jgi:cytochrome c553
MKNLAIGATLALGLSASLAIAGGNADAGKQKSTTCASCHGAEGISAVGMYPNIGGQYQDYLLHSLRAYKSGARQNAIMQGMVASLSDQDMQDLAAFFSSLPGALKDGTTEPK